ncbi:MAG: hypothetical protein ACTHKP_10740 [Nitrososphaeraceae archaeon]
MVPAKSAMVITLATTIAIPNIKPLEVKNNKIDGLSDEYFFGYEKQE